MRREIGDSAEKKKCCNKLYVSFFIASKRDKYIILALINIFAKVIEEKRVFQVQILFRIMYICKKKYRKKYQSFTAIKLSLNFKYTRW